MRWFKQIALTLVAIVVLLLGIGLILPSTFKVQRSIGPDLETGLKNLKALAERSST